MATVSAMFTITDTGDLSGRNLLQRSFFTKDPWTGPTYNAVGDGFGVYHGKYCFPVTTNWLYTNTNKGVDNLFPDLVFEEGVQYTLSGNWAQFRTDDKYNKMYLIIHHTDGTKVITLQPGQNNVWSSFKITSTAGKTVDKIVTSYGDSGITYITDFKLEVGAAATDWTPAPEDVNHTYISAKTANETADYAKTEIDGLEIGGRNILKHSEQAGIINRYANSVINTESDIVVDEWATKTGIRYYGNSGTSTIFGTIGGNVNYIAQKNYTYVSRPYAFSVYVKNLSESSRLRFLVNGNTIAKAVEIAPLEQKRVTYVYSNPNTAAAVQFTLFVDTAGDAFDFVMWHPKIEYGTRVTDWTPAPEDVEESINSKNSVYYQAAAPTGTLKVGDTWFDTDNDYKISRWDGSTWAAAELGDAAFANIDASKIIAGSVMGSVILGGTIQAGGSDVGHDGKVLVKDANDIEVASLSKDGLVATAGSIGGWTITSTTIENEIYDTAVDPPIYSYVGLNSDSNSLLLRKGRHTVGIDPTSIYQRSSVNTAVDEPQVTISDGDIWYSNVSQPIPNETSMSYRKWTEVSASRAIKGTLTVTVYHCMNLFWAHFAGTIPAGWTAENTRNVFIPIITGDTDLTNSALVAPPDNVTKYIIPTDLTNMRITVTVRSNGQLGISRIAEPFKGNATTTIAGYMETCDIFWAHIG